MIFREIRQKPFEYLALLLILVIATIAFFVFSYDPHHQRRVIYATTIAYLGWSLFHHYRRGDLELSIIVEYLIFALFALVLVSSTLL